MTDCTALEFLTRSIGTDILQRIESARTRDFAASLERDPLVAWARHGAAFLANALRFVDVYPALGSDEELLGHLESYAGGVSQFLVDPRADRTPAAVRALIRGLQERFVAGDTLEGALQVCRRLHEQRLATTLDVLGEAVLSDSEAAGHQEAYLRLLRTAAPVMGSWPTGPAEVCSHGPIPRLNVSLKLSSLHCRLDPIDPVGSFEIVGQRLRPILRAARSHGASINVDMEQFVLKDLTLTIFKRILMEDEFGDWPYASITLQTYLTENRQDIRDLADWASERGTPIHVRLVKGAYWDHEVQQAAYRGWPVPVYTRKEQTDCDFEAAVRYALEKREVLRPAVAAHNVRNVAHAMALAETLGLPRDFVEYQVLYGLGDELAGALVDLGCRVRVYTPYGSLVPGMAYLVRRVLEATSRSAFLRQLWSSPLAKEEMLKAPAPAGAPLAGGPAATRLCLECPFENEPASDFSRRAQREQMADALVKVRGEFGRSCPPQIDGRQVETKETAEVRNPGRTAEVIGSVSYAGRREAGAAVRAAQRSFPSWAAVPVRDRATLLLRTAGILRRRRFELAAWEVFEEAKSWREADADVAEAIDYLEYYAREAVRLAAPRSRNVPGESNGYTYEPRGVTAVIGPWNFPLAILTGMAAAAVVTGNTVILKPAEQASIVAAELMDAWTEAGAPPGVVQYLPGRGEVVGDYLVKSPEVSVIAFTGSLAVGLRVQGIAARTPAGQRHLKRVIAEMGGKNAIVLDGDADLDQAVAGVVASAFGYQGQKCSACSRVIVVNEVYQAFLERLVEATRSLPLGPAEDPHAAIGPLISREAADRVHQWRAAAGVYGRVVYEGKAGPLETEGNYVAPLIAAEVDPLSPPAQEEVFGPVLCIIRADSFDRALQIANETCYGLTGGLYSRDPAHIAMAKAKLHVGNLYVNRQITGALVDRQPFGGVKLSGIGSKAGGPDYLLQFMQPKTTTEYTVRRGFAPPEGFEN